MKKQSKTDGNEKDIKPEQSKEYAEGALAFASDLNWIANPYRMGDDRRKTWFDGYYTARTVNNIGHVFVKYGGSYP